MKLPASSLYFKLFGPDPAITRRRPAHDTQKIGDESPPAIRGGHALPNEIEKPPFTLSKADRHILWIKYGMSHGVIRLRGYFSVPLTVEGVLWLKAHGFTQNQIEKGPFIAAPILREDDHPVDYALIPVAETLDENGARVHEILPRKSRSPSVLDIHPKSRHRITDHARVFWTYTTANADSCASRLGPAVALHGDQPDGTAPTALELERLYREANLDKLLLQHIYVVDSDLNRTSIFRVLHQLATFLPDLQIAYLKPQDDGSPATLASFCLQEGGVLLTEPWEEEQWG